MWLLRTLFIRAEAWQVVAALRHNRITAPCVFDDAIKGERFRAYVEQAGADAELRRCHHHGQPSTHKVQGVREAVEA